MVSFKPCGCSPGRIKRIRRSAWMRVFFPSRVLYQCSACGQKTLASSAGQAQLFIRNFLKRRTQ